MNCDARLAADFAAGQQAVVGWILVASYAYYVRDESLLSDEQFDRACQWLHSNYDVVKHRFKHLVPKECLVTGSLHHMKEHEYPEGLRRVAEQLIRRSS